MDVQLNNASLATTSATTSPSSGASETWAVTALSGAFKKLYPNQTYALIDATVGATSAQQAEIIRVTACDGSGDTSITVTRGSAGTTPVAHAASATFNVIVVADYINRLRNQPDYAPDEVANAYSVERGFYNFKSSNTRRLDQGRADSMGSGMTRHLVFGDSVTAGCTSGVGTTTFDRKHSWPLMMRDQLASTGIPANGMGFLTMVDNAVTNDLWTYTGTWLNQKTWNFSSTVNSTATCTADRSGTVLDIWYLNTSGTFTVSIDGAASGVNFATISTNTSGGWIKYRMYGVSINVGSTIQLKITVAGTGVGIGGIDVWSPNAGVIVGNVAISGSHAATGTGAPSTALNWDDLTNGPLVIFRYVGGKATTITDAATTAGAATITSASSSFAAGPGDTLFGESIDQFPDTTGALFPPNTYITGRSSATVLTTSQNALVTASGKTLRIGRDPHCVHIALGGNDIQTGGAGGANIEAPITAIKSIAALYPNSDVILHLQNQGSSALWDPADYAALAKRMYQTADELDVPLYDWRDRAGSYSQAFNNGVFQDYQAHMIPGVYADFGSSLAQALGGGSGQPQFWLPPVYDGDLANRKSVLDLAGRTAGAANVSVTTTVEKVVAQILIPANTFKVGTVIDMSLFMHPAATTITTTRIRIGALGTVSDTCVQIVAASSATNTPSRYVEAVGAVTAIGASAAFIAGGTESMSTSSATGTQTASSGTFNSTTPNWVSVTVQNTSSTTTTVYAARLRVV